MESELLGQIVDLGGTVTTVGMFLWYLMHKNGKAEKAMEGITKALQTVHVSQERQTRVLIQVAKKHKLDKDADVLIEG